MAGGRAWSDAELDIIRGSYAQLGATGLTAMLPGRSAAAIGAQAAALGLTKPGKPWTTKDLAVIREHYPKGGAAACLPLLPGRNEHGIRQQARALKLAAPRHGRRPYAETLTAARSAEAAAARLAGELAQVREDLAACRDLLGRETARANAYGRVLRAGAAALRERGEALD
jgi:hypothetical protein